MLQNIVTNTSKYSHITPILKDLHWLPVNYRINFKILLLVYKALNGQAPGYLSELLSPKTPPTSHNLRSSNDRFLLKIPNIKTKATLGDCAFSYAAPKLWNQLPIAIRKAQSVPVFKSMLKTHLCREVFKQQEFPPKRSRVYLYSGCAI